MLVVCAAGFFALALAGATSARAQGSNDNKKDKHAPKPVAIRWDEQHAGCTFSRGDDGRYRYGLWSGDVGVVLAVDAREVQIMRRRIEPIFSVLLTFRYRGAESLDVNVEGATLQFMKHFKVVQTALDPEEYTQAMETDAETVDDDTRRQLEKHPDKKQVREAREQQYQKSITELSEFINQNSLRPAHLDRSKPEVTGWVFFNTNNKWLGKWKAQEEFVLRVPVEGKVFEFPFKLPPEAGELLLPRRE